MGDEVSLNVYVQRLMRARDISHEDHLPLYRWWLSEEEHEDLRRLIDEKLGAGTPWAAVDCIGFVVFASREFAREYESGPWTWDVIFRRLENRPALSDCYEFVEKGLRWLGLRLHQLGGRRQYLFGLVVEGGLPLGLVKRRGTHLHRYLRHVLEDCERFKRSDPRLLAARQGTDLPLSLQRDEVYALTGELISRIVALRTMVGVAADPIVELDRVQPGWRRLVPLPLEDDVAEALLKGLLTAPKVPVRVGAPHRA